jgi:phosphatidylserine decarboxylase
LVHLKYRGPNPIACNAGLAKGEEMGWFQHGSTIIVFAPQSFAFCHGIHDGARVRMGQALLKLPQTAGAAGMVP